MAETPSATNAANPQMTGAATCSSFCVGVGIVPGGLSHPTIADPTPSVLLKPLADVQLERHLHLAIPSVGELAPAATRFIDEVWHLRNDQPLLPAEDEQHHT
ncbi:MAG TPA: hypothetical protein VGO88_01620 [Mycetocola sp.]|jgi:hypothetical protein|nr:hypothetical protein [Mycetocola sp.]